MLSDEDIEKMRKMKFIHPNDLSDLKSDGKKLANDARNCEITMERGALAIEEMQRAIVQLLAERDHLKARVAELESALRQHLHTNRAFSRPVGQEGSAARRAWEDQVEADRVAEAALAQEPKA